MNLRYVSGGKWKFDDRSDQPPLVRDRPLIRVEKPLEGCGTGCVTSFGTTLGMSPDRLPSGGSLGVFR